MNHIANLLKRACCLGILLLALVVYQTYGQSVEGGTRGSELVSTGERATIRFPGCFWAEEPRKLCGYLYVSADEIRFEVIYPEDAKKQSFRYARADLDPSHETREFYGGARLRFTHGDVVVFYSTLRLELPYGYLLQAATNFDGAVAAARAMGMQGDSMIDYVRSLAHPLFVSHGELVPLANAPVLRFAVTHEKTIWNGIGYGSGTYSSCGYLYFSQQSIRYEVTSGSGTDAFAFDRAGLSKAKEYDGTVELQFSGGKHRFRHLVPVPGQGNECWGLGSVRPGEERRWQVPRAYEDVLEALFHFPAAVSRAALRYRKEMSPSTAAEMANLSERLPAWRAAGAKVDLPEDALRHRVLAEAAYQEKDFDKAVSEYESVLMAYPTWPDGQFNVALILGELQRYADAVAHMNAYLKLTPDAPDAEKAKQRIWVWEDKMK